jgi:predicted metal-binding protein
MQSDMTENVKVEIDEHIDESGAVFYVERYERLIPTLEVDQGDHYKLGCEACKKHGKNLACPPFSPALRQYAGNANTAKVVCLRLPLEYFNHLPFEERYRECFRKVKSLLVEILLANRSKGLQVAGSGPCQACEECSAESGSSDCRNPDNLIYSLESLGVNVVGLVQTSLNLDLEWSVDGNFADYVCAVGAVFLDKQRMQIG